MRRRGNQPGQSSLDRFRQERRAAIRNQRWQLAVMVAYVAGLVVWVAVGSGWFRVLAAFLLGVMVMALTFGWELGFDVSSMRWKRGAFGEQWTADELKKLGSAWRVFHDLPDGHSGNLDHVVVGSSGVFAIDSKSLVEPAKVDAEGLRAGRLRFGGKATRGAAVRLKEHLQRETGQSVWVQGVLAVWGPLPNGTEERDNVLYVHGLNLAEMLQARPGQLDDERRVAIVSALSALARDNRREAAPLSGP